MVWDLGFGCLDEALKGGGGGDAFEALAIHLLSKVPGASRRIEMPRFIRCRGHRAAGGHLDEALEGGGGEDAFEALAISLQREEESQRSQ